MGPKINPEVERSVLVLSKSGSSERDIQKRLQCSEIKLSTGAIHNIIHGVGIRREAKNAGLPIPPNNYPPVKASKTVIKKIDRLTSKENPPGQRTIAKAVNLSQGHISHIIKTKLHKKIHRKRSIHVLEDSHKANRTTNSRRLYEDHLAGGKSEFVVTLDEAWFYLQDCKGDRKICYTEHREDVEKYVCPKREKFGDKIMVVGAITGRGVLDLIKVPPNPKINSARYVSDVLKPLLEKELPKLYPTDYDKVFVHHDKASSHTATFTQQYAEDLEARRGTKIIKNTLIPVKSPDISPMDFFGFGHLKQKMFSKRPTTMDGFWELLKAEWRKITPEMCQGVFSAWKKRCRTVAQVHGEHIEQIKDIHSHRI
ncbi:Transposable element Tcb1 transposase [Folsomia candida]|uniref:Transposable element Tcb1 transposase n=1 Tax=Folsomia candida TaxID=158441 RepID=A0A226DM96_FOLCA|nr:Transposable element Tcb1 transposase [Folsomia candida]